MTREEAIRIIETVFQDEYVYKYYDSITHQALDMAIEALKQVTGKLKKPDDSLLTADPEACKEQKSKLDLISRQAAIDALGEEPPVWCDEEGEIAERNQWRADIEAIKSVPSADRPQGEWIDKEELIDAINDAQFVYDSDEGGHKEYDITELVRVIFKDIISNLSSADMRGEVK